MSEYKWMKTDTAAIMFTAIQNKNSSRVFRVSFVLKGEDIDEQILKRAVTEILPRFPYFCVTFKKGLFWGYFEHTDVLPEIKEESQYPAAVQWYGKNGGPEFRILYYKRRICVEIAHMLTDGTGALDFAKAIVSHYLKLKSKFDFVSDKIKTPEQDVSCEEWENAYKRYYSGEKAIKDEPFDSTYKLPLNPENGYMKAVFGLMPIEDVKERCKEYRLSITEYLAAAEILAIIKNAKEPVDEIIRLSVPINFRNFFPTKTMRNFAGDTTLSFYPEKRTDFTLSEISNNIKGQLKTNVDKAYVQNFINKTFSQTINPLNRIVPFPIKQTVVNASQKKSHRETMTLILTNLGIADLPEEISDKIERVDFVGGDVSLYGLSLISSVISHNGFLNICFSHNNRDTSLCKEFFRVLSNDGIRIRVESSDENGFDEKQKNESGKRCPLCGVDLGEEYTVCPLCKGKAKNEDKKIHGFKTAPYPTVFEKTDNSSVKVKNSPLSFEKTKAYFNI